MVQEYFGCFHFSYFLSVFRIFLRLVVLVPYYFDLVMEFVRHQLLLMAESLLPLLVSREIVFQLRPDFLCTPV